MNRPISVTVWNEFRHEKSNLRAATIYPEGIHGAIAGALNDAGGIAARTATLDEPDHGLTEDVLASTDVLIWWGHVAHGEVRDDIVERLHAHVISGMELICLHSAHYSKIFKRLMGTTCSLKWREDGLREILWCVRPGHPIVEGVADPIIIEHDEMYGEYFDVPQPDELIFIGNFAGGEVFRSGCLWTRGAGKVFYFQPGHETFPVFHDHNVLKVLLNAVRYLAPSARHKIATLHCPQAGWFQ